MMMKMIVLSAYLLATVSSQQLPPAPCVPYSSCCSAGVNTHCGEFISAVNDGFSADCSVACNDILKKAVTACDIIKTPSVLAKWRVYRDTCQSLQPTTAPTTAKPSSSPSATPSFAPTRAPTETPTTVPRPPPTQAPTAVPTAAPTLDPTQAPTAVPTAAPTATPTQVPTAEPTATPTQTPTEPPTATPTQSPTEAPTTLPPTTDKPSFSPTAVPTDAPTAVPSQTPTDAPSQSPTLEPTFEPSGTPTAEPTYAPSASPTGVPTIDPTAEPSQAPTAEPSAEPSVAPTEFPTAEPSQHPTAVPSAEPSQFPTNAPVVPTHAPVPNKCNANVQADVILVLDSSSSISQADWVRFTKFTKDLVNSLPIAPHFMHLGLVEFNTNAKLVAPLMDDESALQRAIDSGLSTTTSGRTFTHLAVDQARIEYDANGRPAPVPRVMVVLTDGLPTNRSATARAFRAAANAGISSQIITIGAEATLMGIPDDWSAPGFPVVAMEGGYEEVDAKRQEIANLICRIAEVPATRVPTELPSEFPTGVPTAQPTNAPSYAPTEFPSQHPTEVPTEVPTVTPTETPTTHPTAVPTQTPTDAPTQSPTAMKSDPPGCSTICTSSGTTQYGESFCMVKAGSNCCPAGYTRIGDLRDCVTAFHDTHEWGDLGPGHNILPEVEGTVPAGCYVWTVDTYKEFRFNEDTDGGLNSKAAPVCKKVTVAPTTGTPTHNPSQSPTATPTTHPSELPTVTPTEEPTAAPTTVPTEAPSHQPTRTPSQHPTEHPTAVPTETPTAAPSAPELVVSTGAPRSRTTSSPGGSVVELPTDAPVSDTHAPVENVTAAPVVEVVTHAPVVENVTAAPVVENVTHAPVVEVVTAAPKQITTWSPVTTVVTIPPADAVVTHPPQVGPCAPAGHLHLDFGGDIANFGATQKNILQNKLASALHIAPSAFVITEHLADENGLNYGALGGGRIWHPTKVQLNFKFVGTESIEYGHALEEEYHKGNLHLLHDFPLLRIEIEEIFCTIAPTQAPTIADTWSPTLVPTEHPTAVPSATPTDAPSFPQTTAPRQRSPSSTKSPAEALLTDEPTAAPTEVPTAAPTAAPTQSPTDAPTSAPTAAPIEPVVVVVTHEPSHTPTEFPTEVPTAAPTAAPTAVPTQSPTDAPTTISPTTTDEPSFSPSATPTHEPSHEPSQAPTEHPTEAPTAAPTHEPSHEPSREPSREPSHEPSATPTHLPTVVPTAVPTEDPTAVPTAVPTHAPIVVTDAPTDVPVTSEPSEHPTAYPTHVPTAVPSHTPTESPTEVPSSEPTVHPTAVPSELPTANPTNSPSGCLIIGAKMHILFVEDKTTQTLLTRRLLSFAAFQSQTSILQTAVATELGLDSSALAVKSYLQTLGQKGNIWHTELMFKGLDAIKLGYKLEQRVLANQFAPLPQYPIHRLYMEEIFDCGEHAVGATHSTAITPNLKFSLPDEGWQH